MGVSVSQSPGHRVTLLRGSEQHIYQPATVRSVLWISPSQKATLQKLGLQHTERWFGEMKPSGLDPRLSHLPNGSGWSAWSVAAVVVVWRRLLGQGLEGHSCQRTLTLSMSQPIS